MDCSPDKCRAEEKNRDGGRRAHNASVLNMGRQTIQVYEPNQRPSKSFDNSERPIVALFHLATRSESTELADLMAQNRKGAVCSSILVAGRKPRLSRRWAGCRPELLRLAFVEAAPEFDSEEISPSNQRACKDEVWF